MCCNLGNTLTSDGLTISLASSSVDEDLNRPPAIPDVSPSCLSDLFQHHLAVMEITERGRPDHVTHRQLLWRCMEQFSEMAQSKSRILVPHLLQFIEYVIPHTY